MMGPPRTSIAALESAMRQDIAIALRTAGRIFSETPEALPRLYLTKCRSIPQTNAAIDTVAIP